jgi:hypothetical protein
MVASTVLRRAERREGENLHEADRVLTSARATQDARTRLADDLHVVARATAATHMTPRATVDARTRFPASLHYGST